MTLSKPGRQTLQNFTTNTTIRHFYNKIGPVIIQADERWMNKKTARSFDQTDFYMNHKNLWLSLESDLSFIFLESTKDLQLNKDLFLQFLETLHLALQPDPSESLLPLNVVSSIRASLRNVVDQVIQSRQLRENILQAVEEVEYVEEEKKGKTRFISYWNSIYMWLDSRPYLSGAIYQIFLDHSDVFMPDHSSQFNFTILLQSNGAGAPGQHLPPPLEYQKQLLKDFDAIIKN